MKAPNNFGQGIIVPIFKKGDKNDLTNYRTPLNSDYKLFMKIITSRLVPILPTIISPGQTSFDTLEWEFLFTVLEEMGFPEIFISLIKNLYENGFSVVSINGFFSSGFFKTRGVNQGDPLPRILYIIAGEVLRLKVKAETK
eukprot:Pgem_evm1s8622